MKFRRFLAIIVTALMLIGMIPSTAMAHAICDKCTWSKWQTEDGSPMSCGYKRTYRQCKVCGNMEYKEEFYDCEWGKWYVVEEATDCQSWDGLKERKCKNCGGVMQDEFNGDHKWGKWKTTKKAICTEKGERERTCTICGEKQSENTSKADHKWGKWKTTKEAGCYEKGKKERTCSACGAKDTENIPDGAHKWGEWTVIQEAMDGQVGIRERVCSVCGKTEREEFYPDGTIKKGDRGESVEELQEALNDQGYDCGKADGIFGNNTEGALKDWQEDHGYESDGIGWPGQVDELLGGDDEEPAKQYSSGINLELLTDCSQLSGELGQTISVRAKITNTGETVLTVNSSIMFDGNGNQPASSGYIHYDIDNGKGGGTSWFEPGETTEGTLNIVVEQSDIDAGEIVRKYTEYARPLYCVVDEKITDVPSGLGIDPEGTNKHTSKEEEKVEDTIEIRIPLAQSDAEETKKYSSGIDLELLTDCSTLSGKLGDEIPVELKVTNIGDITLTLNSSTTFDANGNFPDKFDYAHWDESQGVIDWSFKSGESLTGTMMVSVLQSDIDAGEIYREYTQNGSPFYYLIDGKESGIPAAEGSMEIVPGETYEFYTGEPVSDSVIIRIPLNDEAFKYVTVEKSITSTPANGEYYVEGETISFLIKVVIPDGKTITDLEVTDPLKGGNEDATLDILPTATSADNTEYVFNYVVTAEDVERGYVENSACAYFFDPEGDAWVEVWSETVGAPTGGEIQQDGIVLTKSVVNMPEDGVFHNGNAIRYQIQIANVSDETYYDVIVYDPILEFAELKTYDVMEPGFTDTIDFTYDVTVEDAFAGYVENTAFASHYECADAQDFIYSNTVTVPCEMKYYWVGEIMTLGGIEITKSVTNVPANGQYYMPGENVDYMITVKNTGSLPLEAVTVRDSLYSSSEPVAVCPVWLEPGDQFDASFSCRVTEINAVGGSIKNIAQVVGYDPEGRAQVGLSNEVEVPTGMDGDFPFGVITEMSIVKEETSAPANGTYYTEGETISYKITYTNNGETPFGETLIYDTLKNDGVEIASAEMLNPGESRSCTFSYVVTADDVVKGYVANSAVAKYDIGGGYTNTAISNVVVSDTDGDPNTTYVPGAGKIDWEKIRRTGKDENGNALPAEDSCYIKAVSRDGDSIEYEVHFCTKHAQTQNAILTMAKAAGDTGRQQMVWEYAYALWQKEIEAMYQEILPACDDAAKITVMSERVTHLAMVANTQFALKIAEPGQPAETAYAVAQLWQDKCIDLCYLMNNAPSARVDSIFGVERAQNEAEIYEACSCVITEEEEGKILCADRYCPVHGFTYEMMELLLLTENSVENWATVRSLWEIELNTVYNALYKAASEEGGMAYLAEYAAYLAWVPAYEQCLNMVYPNNPEIVAEVMANVIMGRALDVCGRTN